MGALEESAACLREVRALTDSVNVAYSGGKDSVVVLDMAVRTFSRVHAFFMYMLPDLECAQPAMDYCKSQWGITPVQVPHPGSLDDLRRGVYSNQPRGIDVVPQFKLLDVYIAVRQQTHAHAILDGQKRADGAMRRLLLKVGRDTSKNEIWHPIVGWTNQDANAYLARHGLLAPLSLQQGRPSSGIDLTEPCLLWLHDNFPGDWARILEVFPYAEAAVWRRRSWCIAGPLPSV
jgi:3'-phosphoadenosine 5'-phosphosulfate sulfotransferase (PAPS reductase)/FAD synthetase